MNYACILMALSCCLAMVAADSGVLSSQQWLVALSISGLAATALSIRSLCQFRRSGTIIAGTGRIVWFCLIAVALACLGGWRLQTEAEAYERLPLHLAGHTVHIEGVIKERKNTYDTDKGRQTRYVLNLQGFSFAGEDVLRPAKGALYVTLPENPAWSPSSGLAFTGKVRPVTYYRNEGMYDSRHRDRQQQIIGTVYGTVQEDGAAPVLKSPPSGWTYRVAQIRETLTKRFMTVLAREQAYVLSSLLFGGHYDELPPQLLDSFSATGLIHILSVSGSHISLLLSMIQWLGQSLRLRERWLFLLSAILVLVYGALADFAAPVVRSIIMGLISAYSMTARRDYTSHHALGLAVLGMVLVSPYLVFDLSFRLSCGASAGIVLLQPRIRQLLFPLPSFIRDGLAVCISAQLLLLPYLFYCFHAFPVYSFIANLLVAPVLDLVIVLGLIAAAGGMLLTAAGETVLYIIKPLLLLALKGNYCIAALPGSRLWLGAPPLLLALAYYATVAACFMTGPYRRMLAFTALMALTLQGAWSAWSRPDMTVYIFDVGQDRATCAVTRDGLAKVWYNKSRWANPNQVSVVLVPALRHLGIFRLAEAHVGGERQEQVLAELQHNFSIEKADFLPGRDEIARLGPAGHPYIIYAALPEKGKLEGTCIEIWSLHSGSSQRTPFPDNAAGLVLHREAPLAMIWEEWLEEAGFYGIPCMDAHLGGEIRATYCRGRWQFSYLGGGQP